tara:strand:+ start:1851 stop:2021 length:171 start_codon:yes stop_codon:yes gene_type:complete
VSNIEKDYNEVIKEIREVNPDYEPTNVERQMWMNGYIRGTERALKKQLREDLTDHE